MQTFEASDSKIFNVRTNEEDVISLQHVPNVLNVFARVIERISVRNRVDDNECITKESNRLSLQVQEPDISAGRVRFHWTRQRTRTLLPSSPVDSSDVSWMFNSQICSSTITFLRNISSRLGAWSSIMTSSEGRQKKKVQKSPHKKNTAPINRF